MKTDILRKKVATALRVFRQQGISGVFRVMLFQLRFFLAAQSPSRVIQLEDCEFILDRSVVAPRLKAELLLGLYEKPERQAIKQFLHPELPVIELGGGIGVVSCILNRLLARPDCHLVVEANPDLIPSLTRNRDHNHCQFQITHAAIGYNAAEATLYLNDRFVLSSASAITSRKIRVPTVKLRDLLDHFQPKPDKVTLVCDIEGMEADLIKWEHRWLRENVATLIIEIHPEFLDGRAIQAALDLLESASFRLIHQDGKVHVFQASEQ